MTTGFGLGVRYTGIVENVGRFEASSLHPVVRARPNSQALTFIRHSDPKPHTPYFELHAQLYEKTPWHLTKSPAEKFSLG